MHVIQITVGGFMIVFVAWAALLCRAGRLLATAPARLPSIPCPRCGAVMGPDQAAATVAARESELRRLHGFAKDRVLRLRIPDWRFPCAACGAALIFDPCVKRNSLTVADERRFESACHPDCSQPDDRPF